VERVVDGDTVIAVFRRRELRVRLIGIDAPESAIPDQSPECFGPQSAAFAERSLEERRVNLEFDVERIDQYGRTLAYVWLPGPVLFNEHLVRLGYARVTTYPPNVRYVDRLVAAQAAARQEERGMWSPSAC
jgi:micrococcal nuclease